MVNLSFLVGYYRYHCQPDNEIGFTQVEYRIDNGAGTN